MLKKIVDILHASVRNHDVVCRMGGDEFLLLCGDLNGQDSAEGLARRILRMIHEGALEDMGDLWPTISMGITEVREGDSMELALERADKALYRVKRTKKGSYSCDE